MSRRSKEIRQRVSVAEMDGAPANFSEVDGNPVLSNVLALRKLTDFQLGLKSLPMQSSPGGREAGAVRLPELEHAVEVQREAVHVHEVHEVVLRPGHAALELQLDLSELFKNAT